MAISLVWWLCLAGGEVRLGWGGGRDVFVDAGHSEGGSTGGSTRLSALDGSIAHAIVETDWRAGCVAVGHIGRNGLRGIAGDGAKIDGCHGNVHFREGGAEAVDSCGGRCGCISEIGGHSFCALHAVGREGVCGGGAGWLCRPRRRNC